MTELFDYVLEDVERISSESESPDWIADRRTEAWKAYENLPMPTIRDEMWKYTDFSSLDLKDTKPQLTSKYEPVKEFDAFPAEAISLLSDEAIHLEENGGMCKPGLLINHDSVITFIDIDPELSEKGVIFCSMTDAVKNYPDLVQKHFMEKLVPVDEEKFSSLNAALWSGGIFLYVPKGVEIVRPFRTYVLMTDGGKALFQRSLIVLEQGARATYIEQCRSENYETDSLNSSVAEVIVNDGASLEYVTLQNWGDNVVDVATKRARVERDASVNWVVGTLGGKVTKSSYDTLLTGQGASTTTRGFFVGSGKQHHDFWGLLSHEAPDTTGNLLYKGVLTDQARSVFRGLIKISEEAQRTDSYLTNNNIILSDEARADSVPTLEINANDVKASHGATVGQLDEEEIFYLMSRGISKSAAKRLIINGYFGPVLKSIDSEILREHLYSFIDKKIGV